MLECILQFRKEIGFINKLSGLEMGQILKKRVLRQLRYSLKQIKRNNYPDYSGSLKKMFLFGRQPVDTIRHDVLHGARNPDLIDSQARPVRRLQIGRASCRERGE